MTRSRFDSAPLQVPLDAQEPRWRKWFQDMWSSVNAMALPPPRLIPATGSPMTIQFNHAGRGRIIVSTGTILNVAWSRDNVTYYFVGFGTGNYVVAQGDWIRVNYGGGAPPLFIVVLD